MRDVLRWTAAWALLLGLVLGVRAQQSAPAGKDWNQYRGPQRDGITADTDWKVWAGEPKIAWKASVNVGYSAVTVADGKAYATGNKDNLDTVFCFDAKTGAPIWKYEYACKTLPTPQWPGTRSTPAVVDGQLYTLSSEGECLCLNAADGKLVWAKKLAEELEVKGPQWSFAGSPLPLGEWIVLDMGTVVALDKADGKIAWRSAEKFKPSYASPVLITIGGKQCVAVVNGDGPAIVEVPSGKTVCKDTWKTQYDINACDLLVVGEKFFVTSGYNHGCALYDAAGGQCKKVYENKDLADQFSAPVLEDGYIYGFSGNVGAETLKCVELATGAVKWSGPKVKVGSCILSGDRLIMMGDGNLIIAQANPEGYKELAKARILEGETWTMPVLADGRIYCRSTPGQLVCVDVSGK